MRTKKEHVAIALPYLALCIVSAVAIASSPSWRWILALVPLAAIGFMANFIWFAVRYYIPKRYLSLWILAYLISAVALLQNVLAIFTHSDASSSKWLAYSAPSLLFLLSILPYGYACFRAFKHPVPRQRALQLLVWLPIVCSVFPYVAHTIDQTNDAIFEWSLPYYWVSYPQCERRILIRDRVHRCDATDNPLHQGCFYAYAQRPSSIMLDMTHLGMGWDGDPPLTKSNLPPTEHALRNLDFIYDAQWQDRHGLSACGTPSVQAYESN